LIYPPVNQRHVARTLGTLYFAVYSAAAPARRFPIGLHLFFGTVTFEGRSLVEASPPPGAVIPKPPSGSIVVTYMKGAIPHLPGPAMIHTQLYDDSCQAPVLAGAFSTGP